ncbi:MAG: type II toxin-antitoxin system VapC family toxin [Candidatus Acidiferrales bacterium]
MNRLVVDASVAAKWLLPPADEPFVDIATRLLDGYTNKQIEILVPDLFWVEVGNLLWSAARAGRCTQDHAKTALARIAEREFPTVPSVAVLRLAFEIAIACGRTVYDSVYVALAQLSAAQFVTADEKLVNALEGKYPVISLARYHYRR